MEEREWLVWTSSSLDQIDEIINYFVRYNAVKDNIPISGFLSIHLEN